MTPPPPITHDLVKQYAELGVHRLIGLAPAGFAGPRDVDGMLRFVDELAELARRSVGGMAARTRRSTRAQRAESVARWDRVHDVVIVGHGGAGACAAIEAARAGADTLVLERMGARRRHHRALDGRALLRRRHADPEGVRLRRLGRGDDQARADGRGRARRRGEGARVLRAEPRALRVDLLARRGVSRELRRGEDHPPVRRRLPVLQRQRGGVPVRRGARCPRRAATSPRARARRAAI